MKIISIPKLYQLATSIIVVAIRDEDVVFKGGVDGCHDRY